MFQVDPRLDNKFLDSTILGFYKYSTEAPAATCWGCRAGILPEREYSLMPRL
jgi:hypothetical protein